MDILDILLAKAITPEGQAASAASAAQQAAREAKEAAESIVIPEISIEKENTDNFTSNTVTFGENNATYKNYKTFGENEDGSMTQKAIKNFVEESVQKSEKPNYGTDNAGSVVVVDDDGSATNSTIEEKDIILTQIAAGTYHPIDAISVEIDYENKTSSKSGIVDNPIYNKIQRCIVDDNGEIIAFYGDSYYEDEFSTGYQTMIYIPKFYYFRAPLKVENNKIKKECLYISEIKQAGFKVHPIFINEEGKEVDYFLYSAYEGSVFDVSANSYNRTDRAGVDFENDKLSSIIEAKPISGQNNDLTIANAKKLAQNRGQGWNITSIEAESAVQMLMLAEFGVYDIQSVVESGISNLEYSSHNGASYTGSTKNLGNLTGAADSTINEIDGIDTIYSAPGYRAVSYRGIENFWGNIWRFIDNIEIKGDGDGTGTPYIHNNPVSFNVPNTSNWVSALGYDEEYDWLFMPAEAIGANSTLPIGDFIWTSSNFNGTNVCALGGKWSFKESNGAFFYSIDKANTYSGGAFSARIMYVPTSIGG